MKNFIIVMMFFILTISLYSAPIITFEKEVHDFGDIKEDAGPYEYEYTFSNTGDEPLKLIKVKASWGCTSPSWSTGSIDPGKKGFVKVKYLSKNRPGRFGKSITVTSNAENKVIKLKVKGTVIATPGKLRKRIGQLNSKDNHIDFADVLFPKKVRKTLEIENPTKDKIQLTLLYSPEYISVKISPEILKPKQRGRLIVTFKSKDKNKFGRSTDHIKLNMKEGERNITGTLSVTANVVEDFSNLSEKELANSPIIYFTKNRIMMGEFELHKIRKVELHFENQGKKDLKVHNIQISNKLFKLQNFDRIIKPGEKGKIVISIKPIKTTNIMKSNITIISNDPKHSLVNLIAQGSIKKNAVKPKIKKKEFNINVKNAYYMIKKYKGSDELVILDVRTKEEFEKSHIPDAINIDIHRKNFYKILKILDRSRIYLLYSKSGMDSKEAVMMMKDLKFEKSFNMINGITGWEKSGYPLVKWEIRQ